MKTKNCCPYLNFSDFFGTKGQHLLVVYCIASFFVQKGWRIFKDASPIIAMTLK
jgi:hypothetical protein